MTGENINIADFLNSHLLEVVTSMLFNENNEHLNDSTENQEAHIEQWCVHEGFCDKIEIPNLRRITDYEVFHNGVRQICLHGKIVLTVRYTIRIHYIDMSGGRKCIHKDGYIIFDGLPHCFCLENYTLNIPNKLDIEVCNDNVIVSGHIRLCRKHRCRHEFSDTCHDWNEWNQHVPCCHE